jgi:PEP-CTERM motif-containing protein
VELNNANTPEIENIEGSKMVDKPVMRALSLVACCLLWKTQALAMPINIDFGILPTPSSTFGAASGQVGDWNQINTLFTGAGIVDLSGAATSVTVTISPSSVNPGGFLPLPPGDANSLMTDNFFSPNPWGLNVTGLVDGIYDVYLYSPHHSSVSMGAGLLNGVAFGDMNGDFYGGAFIEGANYQTLSGVVVTGGLLSASGTKSLSSFSGLAGIQLVSSSDDNQVPLPGTISLIFLGLAGLGWIRRNRV